MVHKQSTVVEAYTVLGLEQDASLELVKSTYKQLALKTHPDKNPDDADATAQFQAISEAYNTLVKHLDRSAASSHGHPQGHYHPFGYEEDDWYEDDDDYYYDDDYEDYESDYEERMEFYRFLFEEIMRGRASRFAHADYYRHYHRHQSPPETQEQYSARLRRSREELEQAAERRAREEANRKANQERERERERREAEQRQRVKKSAKKAEVEASRKTAEQKARVQQEQLQKRRSDVFAAARRKDAAAVKKGIWEENVDASGGEIRRGSESLAQNSPTDPMETLLHIAAKNGDLDLVQWLDSHSADPEERNGEDMTVFHIALRGGYSKIITHLFEAYPPKDEDHAPIYRCPESRSNLHLALDSTEPEIVWMVLDNHLHTKDEMDQAWRLVIGKSFRSSISYFSKYCEFVNLFTTFGDYSAAEQYALGPDSLPAIPQTNGRRQNGKSHRPRPIVTVEDARSHSSSPVSETLQTPLSASPSPNRPRPARGQHQRRGSYRPHHHRQSSSPVVEQVPPRADYSSQNGQPQTSNYRGRGRGRGRGHFHGRGRGRGMGEASVAV